MSFALQIIRASREQCRFGLDPAEAAVLAQGAGELWFHAVCGDFSINKSSEAAPGGITIETQGDSVSVVLTFEPDDTALLPEAVAVMRCELVSTVGGLARRIASGTLMVLSQAGRPFLKRNPGGIAA
jgi:hypothetical protein